MTKITPLQGQSIFDIALMSCGKAEAAYEIATVNNISVTDNVEGVELAVESGIGAIKKVVDYYATNEIKPATY